MPPGPGPAATPEASPAATPESSVDTSSPGPESPPATRHPRLSTDPDVRWDQRGKTIALTTYGSSTCPTLPKHLESDPRSGRLTLTAGHDGDGPCTMDLAPHTSIVRLPKPVDPGRPIELTLRQEGQPDRHYRL